MSSSASERRDSESDNTSEFPQYEDIHPQQPSEQPQQHHQQDSMRLLPAVRKYPRVVLYIFAVCPAILLYGFDMVIVSTLTAMPGFQTDFGEKYGNDYILPSGWLGIWTAAPSLGNIAGAAAAGWIYSLWGRRFSLILGAIISAAGIAACFASAFSPVTDTRRGIFLLGKLIEGIAAGQVVCTAQTYSSEIAPLSLRGSTQALLPVMTMAGQLIGGLVVFGCMSVQGSWGYLIALASQWALSVILIVTAVFIPESPPYLVKKSRVDAARRSQGRLSKGHVDSDGTVNRLVALLEQEQQNSNATTSKRADLMECFRGTNGRRTGIVLISHLMPQFFGLGLLSNASYFAQTVGMSSSLSVIVLLAGIVVGLIANIISVWTISRSRRRPLMLWTLGVCTGLWTLAGISTVFPTQDSTIWTTAGCLIAVIFVAGNGIWPASVLAAAETSSLRLRGPTQAIGWVVQSITACVFAVILPYIYNTDEGNIGVKTCFVYTGLCLISMVLVWLYIPEMRGRSAADLDIMFTLRLPTRKFREWSLEGDRGSSATSKDGMASEKDDAKVEEKNKEKEFA